MDTKLETLLERRDFYTSSLEHEELITPEEKAYYAYRLVCLNKRIDELCQQRNSFH